MKKKVIIASSVVIVLLLVIALLIIKGKTGDIKADGIDRIEMKIQIVGQFGMKKIDRQSDVTTIVSQMNRIRKEKVDMGNVKGWSVGFATFDKENRQLDSVSFLGSYINVNNVWYKIREKDSDMMEELYCSLEYEEIDPYESTDTGFRYPVNWVSDESQEVEKLDAKDIKKVIISSPEYLTKVVDKKRDIRKIIRHINGIDKEKGNMGSGGHDFLIRICDKDGLVRTVGVIGEDYMSIYSTYYTIDEKEMDRMRKLYNKLDYEEKNGPIGEIINEE